MLAVLPPKMAGKADRGFDLGQCSELPFSISELYDTNLPNVPLNWLFAFVLFCRSFVC